MIQHARERQMQRMQMRPPQMHSPAQMRSPPPARPR
jgi:hypothetical protein